MRSFPSHRSKYSNFRRSLTIRQKVVQAYEKLHDAGVLHFDVEPRHWLWRADGSVMLIDFECARDFVLALRRGKITHERVQSFYDDEMEHVERLLQL